MLVGAALFVAPALSAVQSAAPSSLVVDDSAVAEDTTWTLPGGVEFPTMLMNTADLSAEQIELAVQLGVSKGLRGVDFHLGPNEAGAREREGVTRAIASVGRDALFLTTKLDKPPANLTDASEAAALARTTLDSELLALGDNSTIDLLLLKDSASCEVMQAQWAVLEEMLATGRARALGMYNFCEFSLSCVLATATTPPAINFIMRHVGMGPDATGLIAYNREHGVRTGTYGLLGEPVALAYVLMNPALRQIARSHGRTVEDVALRYNVQAGYAVSSRITADYAPLNTPTGSQCSADCDAALTAMSRVHTWRLRPAEVRTLDAMRLGGFPQSPTYYSSAGCAGSFATVSHPNISACNASARLSTWC